MDPEELEKHFPRVHGDSASTIHPHKRQQSDEISAAVAAYLAAGGTIQTDRERELLTKDGRWITKPKWVISAEQNLESARKSAGHKTRPPQTCVTCGKTKPYSEYRSRNPDAPKNICKACRIAAASITRAGTYCTRCEQPRPPEYFANGDKRPWKTCQPCRDSKRRYYSKHSVQKVRDK